MMRRLLMSIVFLCVCVLGAYCPRIAIAEEAHHAVFRTTCGDLVVEFLPEVAPKTVAQIEKLIALGAYDGVSIYRIEPGFVFQLDDIRRRPNPLTPEQASAITKVPGEFQRRVLHTRGTLSMARPDNDPDGGETSFSVLLGPGPHLDGKYTVFGRVVRGFESLRRIERLPVSADHMPKVPLRIEQAALLTESEANTLVLETPAQGDAAASVRTTTTEPTIGLTLLVMLAAFATAVAARRRKTRLTNALSLVTFLFAFFLLFAHLATWQNPNAVWQRYYAIAAFAGALLCFQIMTRFETGDR